MNTVTHSTLITYRSTPKPLQVFIADWYRDNRQAAIDLIALLILSVFSYLAIAGSDMTEAFYNFTREHETWQLDDLIFTLGTLIPVYISIFAVRRWLDASRRLKQANTDSLTGLMNRRKGWEVIELEMLRSKRYERPLSIIMLDIDHFKEVNDTHGHAVGDRVLKWISKVVIGNIRNADALIRWGGEEFIIVLPETKLQTAHQLAERLRSEIERSSLPGVMRLTASFGVTQMENDDELTTFLQRADEKLYRAKATGRNRVV